MPRKILASAAVVEAGDEQAGGGRDGELDSIGRAAFASTTPRLFREPALTEFEDTFRRLVLTDPAHRRHWLCDQLPRGTSPAYRWIGLIEAAVSDVRYAQRGYPGTRPRADVELAAALIEWALEDGYPPADAIHELVALSTMSLEAGQNIDDLPEILKPNNVVRQGLSRSMMTRQEAMSRAAELRAIPITEDDFARPGEGLATLRALSQTADHRDYHRLVDTERILTDLRGLVDLITDADLASEVRAWLSVLQDLNPMPTEMP